MRTRNLLRGMLLTFLLLGLTAAAFVPMAAAAATPGTETTTEVTAVAPKQPIQPLGTPAVIPININYTYQAQSNSLVPTTINLKVVNAPTWAIATISPATVYAPIQKSTVGGSQTAKVHATLIIQTTQDAPAYTIGNVQIEADAQSNGGGALGASTGTVQIPISASYFSILDASVPNSVVIARPQQTLNFPLTVTNLGNADTTVLVTANAQGTGLQVSTPPPKTVLSKNAAKGANTIQIPISVETPYHNGYINTPSVLSLHVASNYAYDVKQKGMDTQLSLLITTKGFYVPGPGAGALIGSLAALALVLRRKSLAG